MRELGVKYDTTWKLKHKLMQVMLENQRYQLLTGRIEIDDAYLGGECAGKRGRGSRNKILFIAAVEMTQCAGRLLPFYDCLAAVCHGECP